MKRLACTFLLLPLLVLVLFPLALAAPSPPNCRVEVTARPLWWAANLRQLTVRLASDCPPEGTARVRLGGYGGPGSRATGPTETLSAARPLIVWAGQPRYRTVLWVAASGKTYLVPLQEVRGHVPEEQ